MAQIATEMVVPGMSGVSHLPALPRWRVMLWLVALTVLVGCLAASWLAYVGSVSTSSYNIQRLKAERDSWRSRNEQLKVELAKAQSLTWVEHEAVSRLGMQKAGPLTYLELAPTAVQPTVAPSAIAEPR